VAQQTQCGASPHRASLNLTPGRVRLATLHRPWRLDCAPLTPPDCDVRDARCAMGSRDGGLPLRRGRMDGEDAGAADADHRGRTVITWKRTSRDSRGGFARGMSHPGLARRCSTCLAVALCPPLTAIVEVRIDHRFAALDIAAAGLSDNSGGRAAVAACYDPLRPGRSQDLTDGRLFCAVHGDARSAALIRSPPAPHSPSSAFPPLALTSLNPASLGFSPRRSPRPHRPRTRLRTRGR
jgi:hypothetical protein